MARRALRWGIVGGACCFISWCGLTAVSAGTANAATSDGTGHATATQHGPVDRLVGDVDDVATDLVGLTEAPVDAGAVEGVQQATQPDRTAAEVKDQVGNGLTSADSLTADIDRLTSVATSLHGIGAPRQDSASGQDSTSASEAVDVDAPADALISGGTTAPSVDTTSAESGSGDHTAATSGDARAPVNGHGHAAHVPTAADHVAGVSTIGVGGGEDDAPVGPFDRRAVSSSTTSSSSTGGSTVDGGSGARLTSFHLPYVASSATVPFPGGVEVAWNSAGKPRVSPD